MSKSKKAAADETAASDPFKAGPWTMHPAARKVPRPSAEERKGLLEDIRRNGQLVPAVLWEGFVLDGFSRADVCNELGLQLRTVKWDGSCGTPARFVFAMSARRNLSDDQRTQLAVEMAEDLAPAAKERKAAAGAMGGRGNRKTLPSSDGKVSKVTRAPTTAQQVAEATGVSATRIERALRVKREDPELYEEVRTGEKSLNEAHRKVKYAAAERDVGNYRPPTGVFQLIYDDPSWPFDMRNEDATHRGRTGYPPETIEQIASTPMPADRDCVLAMWTTKQHLLDGSAKLVIERRGFGAAKTFFTWGKVTKDGDKVRAGSGHYGMNCEEFLLIAFRGKPLYKLTGQPTLILQPRLPDHSHKPDVFREILERCFPCTARLELHARDDKREGWTLSGSSLGMFKGAA